MSYQKIPPVGQAVMASSLPVVIASDQTAIPVSVSGGATSAKQDTMIGHLDGLETILATLDGRVDGVEGLLTTIDGDTGNISTKIDILAGAITAAKMQVDVISMPTVTVATHAVTATDLDIRNLVNTDVVTAELSAVDNAVLDAIAASAAAIDTDMTTLIGHVDGLETSNSAILTAVQIMDDRDNGASDGASVSGDVAHDTADAGEPVKIGMKAYEHDGTAPQTAVAEGDRVNAIADLTGRQYVAMEHPRYFHVSADYASAQTNTSVQASPGAGLALNITGIVISNGATAGNITLLNGSGGTVLFEIYPAINGGVSISLVNPIKLSDATALCITSTSVTTHSVFISGFID